MMEMSVVLEYVVSATLEEFNPTAAETERMF